MKIFDAVLVAFMCVFIGIAIGFCRGKAAARMEMACKPGKIDPDGQLSNHQIVCKMPDGKLEIRSY